MNTVTHWVIVGCAFVAAVILTAFGYRKFRQNSTGLGTVPHFPKRCSLFAVALCCFVALLTTNASGRIVVRESAESAESATTETETSSTELPAAITSPKNWQQFRTLWWELVGKYETPKGDDSVLRSPTPSLNLKLSDKERTEYTAKMCKLLGVRDIQHLRASIAATTQSLGGAPWNENSDAVRFSIPMLVLSKSSLDVLNDPQIRTEAAMTRMRVPAATMLKGPANEKMLTRLVALKRLRREGKLDTKAYRDGLDVCARDMWAAMFLTDRNIMQAPMLLSSEGEIMTIGTCNWWNESADKKIQKLEPGQKLYPPMPKEETKLADELRALMKHAPSEKRTAAIKKLEAEASEFPNAWLRGMSWNVIHRRRTIAEISSKQQNQGIEDREWQKLENQRKHYLGMLKGAENKFNAMRKIYKSQKAVEKFLVDNLGTAGDAKSAPTQPAAQPAVDSTVKSSVKTEEK